MCPPFERALGGADSFCRRCPGSLLLCRGFDAIKIRRLKRIFRWSNMAREARVILLRKANTLGGPPGARIGRFSFRLSLHFC
jgi:hypothetical protein